jgi:hypothetical protein
MSKPGRVALYARVFTAEKGKDAKIQLSPMHKYTHAQGWQVTV